MIARRLMLVLVSCASVAVLAASPVRAATPRVAYGPPPAWVEMRRLPDEHETPDDEIRDGVHILLFERQTRVGRGDVERYEHLARRVVSRAGLDEVSQITISFDPSYQQLTIHSLHILRDGHTIDALDPSSVRLLQRETDLEYGIFDGTFTATLVPEDVRVGDVVDYSFSVRGNNPVFRGHYVDRVWRESSNPFRELRFRLLWPADRRLYLRAHGRMPPPATRSLGAYTEYVWDLQDTRPVIPDSQLPDWYDWFSWTQLSDFADWSQVAAWGTATFAAQADSSPVVRKTAQRIAARYPAPDDRLLAALRFVQDQIRYVGIEIGPSSHQPHPPASVLARRFGDCKDKSLLLVTLLRELGIDAAPALVSTDLRTHVEEWHPSPAAFDHAIVRATIDGRVLWVDPTRSDQGGGLPGWSYPTTALPLRAGTKGLERIPARPDDGPSQQIEYRFDSPNLHDATGLVVTTVARNEAANHLRAYFQGNSRDEITSRYLEFYAARFPGIESAGRIDLQDEREANVVRVEEHYRIPDFWETTERGARKAHYYPMEIRSRIFRPDTEKRKMPIGRDHPDHIAVTIRARLPMVFWQETSSKTVDDPAFRLRYQRKLDGRDLVLSYEYQSLADSVPPERAAAYLAHVDQARNLLGYSLWNTPGAGRGGGKSAFHPLRATVLSGGVCLLAVVFPLLFVASPMLCSLALRSHRKGRRRASLRKATWACRLAFVSLRPFTQRAAAAVVLAEIQTLTGRLAEAEALLLGALRRTTGASRVVTSVHAGALYGLCRIRVRQKRFQEADEYLTRAEQAVRHLPFQKPTQLAWQILVRVEMNARLGIVEGAAARIAEAEMLGRTDRQLALGATSARARVAQAEGDRDGARRMFAANVRAAEETFGPDHLFTVLARADLADFEADPTGERARGSGGQPA